MRDLPAIAERAAKSGEDAADSGCVTGALWLADDQEAIEELQAFAVLECAEFDETIVLGACPAPKRFGRRHNGLHR